MFATFVTSVRRLHDTMCPTPPCTHSLFSLTHTLGMALSHFSWSFRPNSCKRSASKCDFSHDPAVNGGTQPNQFGATPQFGANSAFNNNNNSAFNKPAAQAGGWGTQGHSQPQQQAFQAKVGLCILQPAACPRSVPCRVPCPCPRLL